MVNTVRLSVVALATLINVAFMAASENLLSLDTAVWPANDTDLMPEEDFDYGSAIAERKKCPASKKCTDAGGSCIKSRANCDGTVDPQVCKGKKCKCCIPYQTTCPTCPTVPDCPTISTSTCAPCTTQPITTTSGCPEAQGYTRLPGSQRCFKLYLDVNRDWYETMTKCRDDGAIMVKTTDAEAVIIRKGLVEKYGGASGYYAWLDAKYNGAQYVWNEGVRIANDNALWWPGNGMPELKIEYCLLLLNADMFMSPKPLNPYWTTPCAETHYGRKAFCELLM